MTIQISQQQARRLLATYHFTPTDLPGVFARLGTVQYDPLNPVGRNADLVLQARIPGYCVDDWQTLAYRDRTIYDAWDKQACLVPVSDWPMRATIREKHRPYHDRAILQADQTTATTILSAIDERGALSSSEFADRTHMADNNSWYGLTTTKRVLRALWSCGILVTHHRKAGRHYYDRPERVIPSQYFQTTPPTEEAYYRWIITRRYQATGMLRPTAEAGIWSACGDAPTRKRAILELLEAGILTTIQMGEKRLPYYMLSSLLPLLDETNLISPRIIFVGPLDSILWDRKAVQQIFNFDYIWEVYKPLEQRRWGYYVLPVFYGDSFVARLDSRLIGKTWTITHWWWEPGVILTPELLNALCRAVRAFLLYLRADNVSVEDTVDPVTRDVIQKSMR